MRRFRKHKPKWRSDADFVDWLVSLDYAIRMRHGAIGRTLFVKNDRLDHDMPRELWSGRMSRKSEWLTELLYEAWLGGRGRPYPVALRSEAKP